MGSGFGVLSIGDVDPWDFPIAKLFFLLACFCGAVQIVLLARGRKGRMPYFIAFVTCGFLGALGVFAVNYVDHKRDIRLKNDSPVPVSETERADIITVLVIDSVDNGKVRYHLQITNGELPIRITAISSQTPNFMHKEEGPYIPKSLRPRESIAVEGDVLGTAIPINQLTNLLVRIGYSAEVSGVSRDFASSYRFFIDHPKDPKTILPFSVSHDDDLAARDTSREETAARFALPVGTMALVLPERGPDEKPNAVSGGNPQRHFVFDPEKREVMFETKADAGRVMQIRLPLLQSNHPEKLHMIMLAWSGSYASLQVDGMESHIGEPPKKED